ncbi:hypothetical protein QF035_000226 [Streptomyces umbrinus]|uniref:Transmembrane protein n=1 Tax=Streptomyces umbrinus TaxID=67370 RepID=A0ABU0SJI5_9ACTN|nr:hypothetical protein [Streptomyces umbrinus]MDQ1022644.1 hypothetical protein [Streptomyces umbrinus]
MNSVPQHLLSEDRQEYERILDQALRSAPHRPEFATTGQRLNPEQLRTMALNATALITVAAAVEYQHYVKVREELRHMAPSTPSVRKRPIGTTGLSTSTPAPYAVSPSGMRPAGLARRLGASVLGIGRPGSRRISDGVSAQRWAGMPYGRRLLAAVLGLRVRPETPTPVETEASRTPIPEVAGPRGFVMVAAPAAVLTGAVTAIFFLVSLLLKMFSAESAAARTMIATGWWLGAVTAGGIIVYAVARLFAPQRLHAELSTKAALPRRGEPTREGMDRYLGKVEQVAQAKEAWRNALLERGILPFLQEAQGGPRTALKRHTAPPAPTHRMPTLTDERMSPEYTSPDVGGSGQPE